MSYEIIRTDKDKTAKIYDFSRVCDCVLAEDITESTLKKLYELSQAEE